MAVRDETLDASVTARMTLEEREGLRWLAEQRTREVREVSKARVTLTPSDVLRELLGGELERRQWKTASLAR